MASVRQGWVDAVRASAILLMVIFHFCYDLRYFGYVDWGVPNGPGWWQFRYLILTLFLGTVGVSLALAHADGIHWRAFWRRWAQIALAALAITLMSLWVFPGSWIYFGILHFIALASLLGLPLVRRPWPALGLGVALVLLYNLHWLDRRWPLNLLGGWLPGYTEDLVPPLPWLGVVFIGMALGALMRRGRWVDPLPRLPAWVRWSARHSLAIYLLHQPLLFGVFFLVRK